MIILLIILVVALIFYRTWYNSAGQKGKRGEMLISSILSQLPNEYVILNDLVFRTEKGTTQIDHVVVKIVPIVVFTGEAILRNVESRYHVVYEENLLGVINEYRTVCLTDAEVQRVLDILKGNNVREMVSDSQHVENLRTAAREAYATINSGICPKCGGHLVERHGEYGAFYGCSNYPKCRFTTQ